MNLPILPTVTISGRIANRLCIRHSKNGYDYIQLLIYILQNNKATLMPMIAFDKFARKLVRKAQQGDLIEVKAKIDPVSHGEYVAIALVAYDFAFLEPKQMREIYHGKRGKQLHILFPVMPNDVGEAVRLSKQDKKARKAIKSSEAKSKAKRQVPVIKAKVTVRPKQKTMTHRQKKHKRAVSKKRRQRFGGFRPDSDNIFQEASKITHTSFWS